MAAIGVVFGHTSLGHRRERVRRLGVTVEVKEKGDIHIKVRGSGRLLGTIMLMTLAI